MTYAPPPPGEPSSPPPAPPPAGAPPGAPPPGYQAGWVQPVAAAPSVRPTLVTAAGVTMIAVGAIIVLFGLLFLLAGAIIGGAASQIDTQMPGFGAMSGAVTGVVIVLAIILLAVGILDILAGAKVFSGRPWARMTGIVLAVILGLLGLGSLGGGGDGGNVVLGLVWVAANAFIVFALATTGSWFGERAPG
jgi:hypothetical protein